jgi:hypothetical protein
MVGAARVAKETRGGKVKVTVADLDRLIRLEEFLREEEKAEGTKIVLEWHEYDAQGNEIGGVEDAGSDNTEETD